MPYSPECIHEEIFHAEAIQNLFQLFSFHRCRGETGTTKIEKYISLVTGSVAVAERDYLIVDSCIVEGGFAN